MCDIPKEVDKTFKCDWCEEDYSTSLRFDVSGDFKDDEEWSGFVCPDCLGTLLIEDPESIIAMTIDRSCEVKGD